MIDDVLRRLKDTVYEPLARQVGQAVSPITITLIGGGVGVLASLAAWQGWYGIGLGLWLLNRAFDGLDGAVARLNQTQSDLGGYIDTLTDFAIYTLIPLGLALSLHETPVYIALSIMIGAFYINAAAFLYLSAILERRSLGAKQRGELTTIHMPKGLVEGFESIVFYILFFLFPQALGTLFLIFGALVVMTTLQHVVWSTKNLK